MLLSMNLIISLWENFVSLEMEQNKNQVLFFEKIEYSF